MSGRSWYFVKIADKKMKAAKNAFDASIDGGITFFDTAEVYGSRVRKSRLIVPLLFCFTQIDSIKIWEIQPKSSLSTLAGFLWCYKFWNFTRKVHWFWYCLVLLSSKKRMQLIMVVFYFLRIFSGFLTDLSRKGKKRIQKWRLLLQRNLQLCHGGWVVRVSSPPLRIPSVALVFLQ